MLRTCVAFLRRDDVTLRPKNNSRAAGDAAANKGQSRRLRGERVVFVVIVAGFSATGASGQSVVRPSVRTSVRPSVHSSVRSSVLLCICSNHRTAHRWRRAGTWVGTPTVLYRLVRSVTIVGRWPAARRGRDQTLESLGSNEFVEHTRRHRLVSLSCFEDVTVCPQSAGLDGSATKVREGGDRCSARNPDRPNALPALRPLSSRISVLPSST